MKYYGDWNDRSHWQQTEICDIEKRETGNLMDFEWKTLINYVDFVTKKQTHTKCIRNATRSRDRIGTHTLRVVFFLFPRSSFNWMVDYKHTCAIFSISFAGWFLCIYGLTEWICMNKYLPSDFFLNRYMYLLRDHWDVCTNCTAHAIFVFGI